MLVPFILGILSTLVVQFLLKKYVFGDSVPATTDLWKKTTNAPSSATSPALTQKAEPTQTTQTAQTTQPTQTTQSNPTQQINVSASPLSQSGPITTTSSKPTQAAPTSNGSNSPSENSPTVPTRAQTLGVTARRKSDQHKSMSGTFLNMLSGSPTIGSGRDSLGKCFTPTREIYRGWLEIRAMSMIWNPRFFVLHIADKEDGQVWLSYFKNEQVKRSDCYGHIKLRNSQCKRVKNTFTIQNTHGRCIFSVDGPQSLFTPASTSHRVFRLSSDNCHLRAGDSKIVDEWLKAIEQALAISPLSASTEEEDDADEDDLPKEIQNLEDIIDKIPPMEESPTLATNSAQPPLQQVASPVPEIQRTEVELKALTALKERIPQLIEERKIDDTTLCRFAKARGYEPKPTIEMLKGYFEWRDVYKPENIEPSQIQAEIAKRKATFYGYDKFDRPILLVWAAKHIPKESDIEVFMKYVIYLLEQAIAHMKPPGYQFTAIIDLKDWGRINFELESTKVAAHMLQNFYPERMGVVLLLNPPFLLRTLWGAINKLLDERTQKKIRFLSSEKQLTEFVDLENLPRIMGGGSDYLPPDGSVGIETLEPGFSFKQ